MKPKTRIALRRLELAGTRVFLRVPDESDLKEFMALNRRSKPFHRGLVAPPVNAEQFRSYLERSRREDSASFMICRLEDDGIVGAINLSQIFRAGFQSAYLGYFIGVKHAGKGYATEALQLMLKHAFKELKLHRVEANIQPGNVASVALVKRAGFVREGYSRCYLKISGRWRDHERWALLAQDWMPLTAGRFEREERR